MDIDKYVVSLERLMKNINNCYGHIKDDQYETIVEHIQLCIKYLKEIFEKKENLCEVMEQFIFLGQKSENKPISRIQAFRIISSAAKKCLLSQKVSCHSLRKTFGYHAWKKGVSPALLTSIYNHSSYKITTRYLGIDQDDRDEVFCLVNL